jgi:2-methylcitrate dehydratase PrpD
MKAGEGQDGPVAALLAQRIGALSFEDLPPAAIHFAKAAILDTIGVTLAGSLEPAARIVRRNASAGQTGPSLLLGCAQRTSVLTAALVNGTAAHVLDFDDCSNTLGGHPSAPVVPALLALGEAVGSSGKDLLLAYVAAYETQARIARGVNFWHYEKGWHPTATLGVFGAAAGCGRLLGLADEQIEIALGVAVSFASGVKANFGTMTKALHVGHAARNGLFAALLARDGFTAAADAFEHKQGFLAVFNGPGSFDVSRILDGWANPLDIVEPGVAIKQYPCCGSIHPALDAMLQLVRAHRFSPESVEQIQSWTHSRRLAHTNRPNPEGPLEAKFSVQYCLARAAVDGKVVLEHFEGGALHDARIRSVMKKVQAAPYTDAQFDPSNHFGAEVKVTMSDGCVLAAKVDQALGRTSSNPLPPELLRAKFDACARRVLPPPQVKTLLALVEGLDTGGTVRALTAAMETAPADDPAPRHV